MKVKTVARKPAPKRARIARKPNTPTESLAAKRRKLDEMLRDVHERALALREGSEQLLKRLP